MYEECSNLQIELLNYFLITSKNDHIHNKSNAN